MNALSRRLVALERRLPVVPCNPHPDLLVATFLELGLSVDVTPAPDESLSSFLRRCPLETVLTCMRWWDHGIRP